MLDNTVTKLNFKFIIGCNNDSLEKIKKEKELKNVRFQSAVMTLLNNGEMLLTKILLTY